MTIPKRYFSHYRSNSLSLIWNLQVNEKYGHKKNTQTSKYFKIKLILLQVVDQFSQHHLLKRLDRETLSHSLSLSSCYPWLFAASQHPHFKASTPVCHRAKSIALIPGNNRGLCTQTHFSF